MAEFYNNVDLAKIYSLDAPNYLAMVSESSKVHEANWRELSRYLPGLIWITSKAQSEILANAANLRTIAEKCRQGRVAVRELAEILKLPKLAEADEAETKFFTVSTDNYNEKIVFRFQTTSFDLDWDLLQKLALLSALVATLSSCIIQRSRIARIREALMKPIRKGTEAKPRESPVNENIIELAPVTGEAQSEEEY